MIQPLAVRCISKTEAFAEKFRAALTRREPAIRDFFDIDYGVRKLELISRSEEMIGLVNEKLAVPGNYTVNVSNERLVALQGQVEAQLKPVLRESDFQAFDLDRSFNIVAEMAKSLNQVKH